MPSETHPEPFATNCHIGPDFTQCDPAELLPLLEHLQGGQGAVQPIAFSRGTLLPDGRLDLCKQGIGPDGTRAVMRAVRGNAHVRHLLLGADGVGDAGAEAVAALARDRDDLQTIFLGCNAISAAGVVSLAEALRHHSQIKGLWLKRNPIGLRGAYALAELVANNRSLRTLDLVNSDLGQGGVSVIVKALLGGNAPVERLYLCGNRLMADGVPTLVELLRRNGPLRHLYLSVNRLGDEGVSGLAPGLADNRALRTLSLASNSIGPSGAHLLTDALRGHPTLVDLDLGFTASTAVLGEQPNRLGDGVVALAELLLDNPALRILDLKNAGVTERGALALIEALTANRSLTALVLDKQLPVEIRRQVQELLARNRVDAEPAQADPDLAAIRSVYRTA